jgi:O-antigen/teichoic acid export membrane protein
LLNYARSFGTFFLVFATLGLHTLLMRKLIEFPELTGKLLGTTLLMRFAASLIATLVFLGMTQLIAFHNYLTNVLILLVVASTFFQSFDSLASYFQARVKSHYPVKVRFLSVILFAALQLVLIHVNAPLIWSGWAFLIRNVIAGFGMLVIYLRWFGKMSDFSFELSYAKELFLEALPLIFSGVVVILYMKVDQVMIMNLMGDEAVGQYAAALRFSEIWYFGGGLLTVSLFPAIINAKKHSQQRYLKRLQHFYDLMVYVSPLPLPCQ